MVQLLLLSHIMCQSCSSILAHITVSTFMVNEAEGWWCLIFRHWECDLYIKSLQHPFCRICATNTNCTVPQNLGIVLLHYTAQLSEFKLLFSKNSHFCLVFLKELILNHSLCLLACRVSHNICIMLMLMAYTVSCIISKLPKMDW